jgi:glutathione S-transferase
MMILHHYPMSPFSEKIRLMCGYLDLEWQSVMSPESPPRPIVEPLAGGYRRIPVAQDGADIFCDTRLICREIATAHKRLQLDPAAGDEASRALAAKFESEIFWAAVSSIPARQILRRLFSDLSFLRAIRFLKDRAGVAKTAQTEIVSPKRAVGLFAEHLQSLEKMLAEGQQYLGGDSPVYLDLAAYHPLWFKVVVGAAPIPSGLPAVEAWYGRMAAFGHGRVKEGCAEDAYAAARTAQPRPVPVELQDDPGIGAQVVVAPDDYALDATSGVLVGADQARWIVARETADLGLLHVHFPRQGFKLTGLA